MLKSYQQLFKISNAANLGLFSMKMPNCWVDAKGAGLAPKLIQPVPTLYWNISDKKDSSSDDESSSDPKSFEPAKMIDSSSQVAKTGRKNLKNP